jgi:hypothetical protein
MADEEGSMTTLDPVAQLRNRLASGETARSMSLQGANLRAASFDRLRADGVDLADADLREASFTGTRWKGSTLRDARLESADFTDAVLRMCDLDQVRAANALFVRARLENSTARGARFDAANLASAVLTDTDFSRASLHAAILEGVSASGVDLRGADLRGAMLRRAMLVDADLRGADLTGADLQDANLHGADLRGAIGLDAARLAGAGVDPELPPALTDLSETMAPIVAEVLRTAGESGAIDRATADRLIAESMRRGSTSPRHAPHPQTMAAVSRVLNDLGDDVLPALVGALDQPNGSDPPAQVKALIGRLRRELSLGPTATAEEVLQRLIGER